MHPSQGLPGIYIVNNVPWSKTPSYAQLLTVAPNTGYKTDGLQEYIHDVHAFFMRVHRRAQPMRIRNQKIHAFMKQNKRRQKPKKRPPCENELQLISERR